jgi:serine/threonine protein kinase
MEFIEGRSVQDMLESGPVEPSMAVDIISQLVQGLRAAHQTGLVHRDIKPANVMVDKSGRACLLDFGLAGPSSAEVSSSVGTIAFMSPEQATGGAVDERSDLFSLGAVLYYMLSGRPPFMGEYDAAVKYTIVNEPHPPIDETATVPSSIVEIVDKLLEKEPDKRFQSAEDLRHKLNSITGSSPPVFFGADRRRWLWPALAVVMALALIIVSSDLFVAPPETGRKMLVVLPFENIGDSVDNYFANGITNEITTQLASLRGLGVISRTSAMKYSHSPRSLPT